MTSDEQLVDAARGGSDAAFEELVERYQERLLRFLLTRCPSRADAEDALQDTFMNAYRYLDSYDPRWRFSTWIYRIGIRNAMRLATIEPGVDTEVIDHDADPLNDCIAAAERDNLWTVAGRCLPHDACSALWLRYVEDMSVRDISVALERSESWTKVTLLRARRKLSEAMLADEPASAGREAYGQV